MTTYPRRWPDMAKVAISERHWDMSGWDPAEIVVEGLVMAVEGCGANEDRLAVIDDDGRELRIIGVRRHGSRVEIVISTQPAGAVA
jgi:hypothetical protein